MQAAFGFFVIELTKSQFIVLFGVVLLTFGKLYDIIK